MSQCDNINVKIDNTCHKSKNVAFFTPLPAVIDITLLNNEVEKSISQLCIKYMQI